MDIQATPSSPAAEQALKIYSSVLESVRADKLVRDAVSLEGGLLFIQGRHVDLDAFNRVFVAGAGKASVQMGSGLVEILGSRVSGGLLVTRYLAPVTGLDVLEGGHPVPSSASLTAGQRMLELAASCNEKDLVLFVLSGGASALMESLRDGVSLDDLQATTKTLLEAGVDIRTINGVRSRLSLVKGGGLARAFAPATVIVLVLSDVIGNDLATIGSGPFVAPSEAEPPFELIGKLPESVRHALLDPLIAETPSVDHFVVGSVSVAIHAAIDAAESIGLVAHGYSDPMSGEAREMARRICARAKKHIESDPAEPFCLVFGGETTVTIRGSGSGGRCTEMALAATPLVGKLPHVAFLAAGTDGADGPTDAAGGLVDDATLGRARAAGLDFRKALAANDSYPFLEACGGLVRTGPTGSNVTDVCLVVYLPM